MLNDLKIALYERVKCDRTTLGIRLVVYTGAFWKQPDTPQGRKDLQEPVLNSQTVSLY